MSVEELRKQRFRYLYILYELSGASKDTFPTTEIYAKLGVDDDIFLKIDRSLLDHGLIDFYGGYMLHIQEELQKDPMILKKLVDFHRLYGLNYEPPPIDCSEEWLKNQESVPVTNYWRRGLTSKGLEEVEQALSKPESPTEHFPAHSVNYIVNIKGDMINSGIQQSAHGSVQEIKNDTTPNYKKQKIRILFVSANPRDTVQLQLIKECNNIRDRITFSEYGTQFDFDQRHEVSVSEMDKILLDYKPQVLHFSGHGNSDGIIVFQDSKGTAENTTVKALSDLFKIVNGDIKMTQDIKIKLVFLSACYSEKQAKSISEYVDCVIGMSHAVTDEAARIFAESFYQAIGYGKSVKIAFDLACNQIARLSMSEDQTPRLLCRPGIEPSSIYLTEIN